MALYTYADDMVLASRNIDDLQKCVNNLNKLARENDPNVNPDKTVTMIFRKGGKVARHEHVEMENEKIKIVNSFKYLGITLQTTCKTFSLHTKERAITALKAMNKIQYISLISLETAMKLFRATIMPILAYGIEIFWNKLKKKDFKVLENVKATYLKKVLGVSKFTPSRLVYVLTRETLLIEDIRFQYLLQSTGEYEALREERNEKEKEIWDDFYCTSAMLDRNWMGPNQELRHVVTRTAVHGFHHKICNNDRFHDPSDKCVCKLCGRICLRYHVLTCPNVTKSLTEYSKET